MGLVLNLAVLTVMLLAPCSANIPGICIGPPAQASFSSQRISGAWYEMARVSSIPINLLACTTTTFVPRLFQSLDIIVSGTAPFGVPISTTSRARRIRVRFPGVYSVSVLGGLLGDEIWRFVDTDYVNYAVIFTCRDVWGVMATQSVKILSRNRGGLSDQVMQYINRRLFDLGVRTNNLVQRNQTSCFLG